MHPFNVRVYGLLINSQNEVLISDEQEYGMKFSKFPGGGLEFGEGLVDGLKREFMEECAMGVEVLKHFYTTDFFVKSLFSEAQLISVYYTVKNIQPINLAVKTTAFDFDGEVEPLQCFRWVKINELKKTDLTFPVDQYVVELLHRHYEFS
ncbi:NUDIX hydrolase [Mucilaginibacter sp. PPCGB 2223]|uniref:NUDIX domain-containing protein n=1 Tax=Mucilaginibacter sp. PPCGB 2223 TaxID=1886027 RepID=UPI000826BA44|nr:NUDIX domain-containing protein [Mucilaginibacter sp. PPCGB 2223]OCX53965.1 NUDIX hydrolase [Mucilaginibacter sp. PPCGB 2223]